MNDDDDSYYKMKDDLEECEDECKELKVALAARDAEIEHLRKTIQGYRRFLFWAQENHTGYWNSIVRNCPAEMVAFFGAENKLYVLSLGGKGDGDAKA